VIEYCGAALAELSTDERATLTNMAAEIGAFSSLVVPDAETQRFLKERRGLEFELEDWMTSDPDAEVACTLEVDCSALRCMVALPGDPGRGVPIEALEEDVRIDIAYGGSCTGGKRDDITHMHEVVQWALSEGMNLPVHVQLFIQFGSEEVRKYAQEQGWIALFEEVGAHVLGPGCGACINAGPGVSQRPGQVTLSAVNRNHPGRSGPGQVWLASPATVAASAFAGKIQSFEALKETRRS